MINYSYSWVADDEDEKRKKKWSSMELERREYLHINLFNKLRSNKSEDFRKSVHFKLLREFLQKKGTIFLLLLIQKYNRIGHILPSNIDNISIV